MLDPAAQNGPLRGLKVIDLATMMAAPWAATFLADYGADVIKVENPQHGDHARQFGLSKDGHPVFWKTLARNKRSVTANLKDPRGQEVARRLMRGADVIIENFRPGVLGGWNLGYEKLSAINERIIFLSITGYGQTGPYAKRAGFGTLIEAMSGFAYANGHPDGPPTLPAIPLADGVAGVFGALSVMMAVYERDVLGSGRGQHIDMSLFEPLARLHEGHMLEYSALGLVRERLGNRSLSSAPRNAYKAADGRWVALSASAQPIFERLMEAIGMPEFIRDPRFLTNHDRIQNSLALDAVIEAWISQRDRDEVIDTLSKSGAAVGPVYSVADLLDDPQVKARESFESHHDPDLGDIVVPSVVAKFSRTPGSVKHLGQRKGQATPEVLKDLGYSEEEIKDLQESGAV